MPRKISLIYSIAAIMAAMMLMAPGVAVSGESKKGAQGKPGASVDAAKRKEVEKTLTPGEKAQMAAAHGGTPSEKKADPVVEPWPDDTVIMKFGKQNLTYADMKKRFMLWTGGKALTLLNRKEQERFFAKYFYEKLFVAEARARGLDKSQSFIDRTKAAKYRALEPVYKVQEFTEKIKPTDAELLQYLPPAEDEVQLRVIVKKEMEEAKKVFERAKSGEDYEALVMSTSEGFNKSSGGLSPWLSMHRPQKYPPPTVERFLKSDVGTVLEPFYMDIGFLVVKVVGKRSGEDIRKSELEVRRSELVYKIHETLFNERMKDLRASTPVVYHKDVIEAFVKKEGKPGDVALEIGNEKFLASEVLEEMIDAGHGGQPIVQRVERFADTAIVAREAIRLGYESHPAFLEAWSEKEDQALARELSRQVSTQVQKEEVTKEEAEAYVKANPDKFMIPETRLIYTVMVGKKEKAALALSRIEKGEDFSKVAREMSEDPGSATKGGEMGWLAKNDLPKPFQEDVFGLADGSYLKKAIEVQGKEEKPVWFLFRVGGVRKSAPASMDRVNLRTVEGKVKVYKISNRLWELSNNASSKFGYELCIGEKEQRKE